MPAVPVVACHTLAMRRVGRMVYAGAYRLLVIARLSIRVLSSSRSRGRWALVVTWRRRICAN